MPDETINATHDGPVALGAQPQAPEVAQQDAAAKQEEAHFTKAISAVQKAEAALADALKEMESLNGFPFVPGVRSTIGMCRGLLNTLEGIHLRENEALARRLGKTVR